MNPHVNDVTVACIVNSHRKFFGVSINGTVIDPFVAGLINHCNGLNYGDHDHESQKGF